MKSLASKIGTLCQNDYFEQYYRVYLKKNLEKSWSIVSPTALVEAWVSLVCMDDPLRIIMTNGATYRLQTCTVHHSGGKQTRVVYVSSQGKLSWHFNDATYCYIVPQQFLQRFQILRQETGLTPGDSTQFHLRPDIYQHLPPAFQTKNILDEWNTSSLLIENKFNPSCEFHVRMLSRSYTPYQVTVYVLKVVDYVPAMAHTMCVCVCVTERERERE